MPRLALALVLVAAAACGSGAGDQSAVLSASTSSPAAPTTSPAPAPTAAPTTTTATSCGAGGDTTTGMQERTITTTDGNEREWLLFLPESYAGTEPADVVFNFHGHGSTAAEQFAYGSFTDQAERDGVILVAPQGGLFNPLYGDGAGWNANLRSSDVDIDFVHELVDLLRTDYCVGDFHATGMSAGGDMVSTLACLADTPFQAFGPVTYLYYNEPECGSAPPRPMVYFHGTDDFVVPMQGSGEPWNDPPVPEAMQRWADHNGCDAEPREEQFTPEVTRISWTGCDSPVEWYLVEGGGHTWPGSIPIEVLGHTTQEISASEIIWDLFFG